MHPLTSEIDEIKNFFLSFMQISTCLLIGQISTCLLIGQISTCLLIGKISICFFIGPFRLYSKSGL